MWALATTCTLLVDLPCIEGRGCSPNSSIFVKPLVGERALNPCLELSPTLQFE